MEIEEGKAASGGGFEGCDSEADDSHETRFVEGNEAEGKMGPHFEHRNLAPAPQRIPSEMVEEVPRCPS